MQGQSQEVYRSVQTMAQELRRHCPEISSMRAHTDTLRRQAAEGATQLLATQPPESEMIQPGAWQDAASAPARTNANTYNKDTTTSASPDVDHEEVIVELNDEEAIAEMDL